MDLNIIYQDSDVLVIDKLAGVVVFPEGNGPVEGTEKTLIDYLLEQFPDLKSVGERPRYGIVHRLDKDPSGILLVAKTPEALIFLQKQFSAGAKALADKKNRPLDKTLEKRYIALATGVIEEDKSIIHTLIARSKSDPRKQSAHSLNYTDKKDLREAISEYKVLEKFTDPSTPLRASYTLLEVKIKTGRKHQIRCHLAYIHHPVAGDKLYGFKDSPLPKGLERQFLHASYLKIELLSGEIKEFNSELPEELKDILKELKPQ